MRIGLTDYLQQLNGDVAFAHVKPVGTKIAVGDEVAELETVKANLSLYSPVSGTGGRNQSGPRCQSRVHQPGALRQRLAGRDRDGRLGERACEALLDPQAYLSAMKSQAEKELSGS